MPLNGVNLGVTKERPGTTLGTSIPGLTDPLTEPKERLMPQSTKSPVQAYRPTLKELGVLRRRLIARGWSREAAQLLVDHCADGTDPVFARYLVDRFVYRKGRR